MKASEKQKEQMKERYKRLKDDPEFKTKNRERSSEWIKAHPKEYQAYQKEYQKNISQEKRHQYYLNKIHKLGKKAKEER